MRILDELSTITDEQWAYLLARCPSEPVIRHSGHVGTKISEPSTPSSTECSSPRTGRKSTVSINRKAGGRIPPYGTPGYELRDEVARRFFDEGAK